MAEGRRGVGSCTADVEKGIALVEEERRTARAGKLGVGKGQDRSTMLTTVVAGAGEEERGMGYTAASDSKVDIAAALPVLSHS